MDSGDTLGYWVRQGLTHDLEWVGYDTSMWLVRRTRSPYDKSELWADGEVNTMMSTIHDWRYYDHMV